MSAMFLVEEKKHKSQPQHACMQLRGVRSVYVCMSAGVITHENILKDCDKFN